MVWVKLKSVQRVLFEVKVFSGFGECDSGMRSKRKTGHYRRGGVGYLYFEDGECVADRLYMLKALVAVEVNGPFGSSGV